MLQRASLCMTKCHQNIILENIRELFTTNDNKHCANYCFEEAPYLLNMRLRRT